MVFMHPNDMADQSIFPDMPVEIEAIAYDGQKRRLSGYRARPYNIPRGSIGAYYPETHPLLPFSHYAPKSKTPAAKSLPLPVRPK
jgi:hypothetical protein